MSTQDSIVAIEEFGRIMEKMAREAEAELKARGIERDDRVPVLDQLAEVEGVWSR